MSLHEAIAKFHRPDRSHTRIMKGALTGPLVMRDGILYGWGSVIERGGVPIVDRQDDIVPEETLVRAVHEFMSKSRVGGALHIHTDENGTPLKVGEIVESVVLTRDLQKALGIDCGQVGWLVGFKIDDPAVRKVVQGGGLLEFSIGGKGQRVFID
ncbi:MAG: XkdF-like putative serine protease domain-containing protein [Alphaproteobacteria bacterium]